MKHWNKSSILLRTNHCEQTSRPRGTTKMHSLGYTEIFDGMKEIDRMYVCMKRQHEYRQYPVRVRRLPVFATGVAKLRTNLRVAGCTTVSTYLHTYCLCPGTRVQSCFLARDARRPLARAQNHSNSNFEIGKNRITILNLGNFAPPGETDLSTTIKKSLVSNSKHKKVLSS
jgi:hypothetical protein